MSLDRQRLDNFAALSAGRPIPQYGPPSKSDREIAKMYAELTWWDKLMSIGTYLSRIRDVLGSTPFQSAEKTNLQRLELYPSPNYLDPYQINLLHSHNQLRAFNNRTFEQAIYYFDLFARAIQSIETEPNIDLKTSNFLNALQYSRNTIERIWSIQYSIDGQLEFAHQHTLELLAKTKINHRTHLVAGVNSLNNFRAMAGYPPVDLADMAIEGNELGGGN